MSSSTDGISESKEYHVRSLILETSGIRCPMCFMFKKKYFCSHCVSMGRFYNMKKTESMYAELREQLTELEDAKKETESRCLKQLEARIKADELLTNIRQTQNRMRIMRLALEERKKKRSEYTSRLTELKKINQQRSDRIKMYKNKCDAVEMYVDKGRDRLTVNYKILNDTKIQIKKLVRLRLDQLFKYIFPIGIVNPTIEMESSDEMLRDLAEATQTNYIGDKWVYTDYSGELKYSIVEPTLPGSGNYSAWTIWMSQNKHIVLDSSDDAPIKSPAYSISAALTYTTQLVNVLSFYLNVRLPYKLQYSDFGNIDLEEPQFYRRVARLNANIIYLCISQNLDLSCVRPHAPLHNILQLITHNSADLGRDGPVTVDGRYVRILQQSIPDDLRMTDCSDSEETDSTGEWEAVPHVQCPEVSPGPVAVQSTQMFAPQQVSSMAGGLVNSAVASVASIWRGFTGR